MIELKDAQAQMERMMGLEFGPRGREQRQEVLSRMCQARTVLILQGAVTAWLDGNIKFPKPAEIAAIITGLNVRHDEVIETAARRKDWEKSAVYARSPRGKAEAKQDLVELRALFVERLATVDQRHADNPGGQRERERIKREITKMIAHIDNGATFQGLIGARVLTMPPAPDDYHGDF
jgi:hypothetical protein